MLFSEKLEKEVVDSILQSIVKGQDYSVKNLSDIFARNLYMACLANSSLINIVFFRQKLKAVWRTAWKKR